jgi:hypothetical protein
MLMLVPKTTMHTDRLPLAAKDDIGISREIARMQPVSVAERMQQLSNKQFGPCVALFISLHNGGNCGRGRYG